MYIKDNMIHDNHDNIQTRESTLIQARYTIKWTYMSKWAGESWQEQNQYAKIIKRINQCHQHVNVLNEYDSQA